jgi:hypothetical protein
MAEKPSHKVFISYSQESEDHCTRVLQLSDRLRRDGIDCVIDQYEQAPSEGWPRWMARNIDEATYVLIICTKTYDVRATGNDGSICGKGVKFESLLTYQEIVDSNSNNSKYIPVTFAKNDKKFIPRPLRSFQLYNLEEDSGYENLYRRITAQPMIQKPKRGKMKQLPVGINLVDRMERITDSNRPQYVRQKNVRVTGHSDSSQGALSIELVINQSFENFSDTEQKKLLAAISTLLSIDYDLKIKTVRPGSVILTLELPRKDALKLYLLSYIGKLKNLNVIDATLRGWHFTSVDDLIQEIMLHEPNPPAKGTKEKGSIVFVDVDKGYGLIEREKGGFLKFIIADTGGSPIIGKSVSYISDKWIIPGKHK